MNKKCLIISSLLFDESRNSRSLQTYFDFAAKENYCQIYTEPKNPTRDYCSSFYRITDKDVLKSIFNKGNNCGTEFDNLLEEKPSQKRTLLYKIGAKKTYLKRYLRYKIWHKHKWVNEKLDEWLKKESPDYIFVALITDTNLLEIALYAQEKLGIPIVFAVYDDLLFSLNKYGLLKRLFIKKYRDLFSKLNRGKNHCLFVSEKMQKKYVDEHLVTCPNSVINISSNSANYWRGGNNKLICYGALCYGREYSLIQFAKSNPGILIDYYGVEKFKNPCKNLTNCGFVAYEDLCKKISEYNGLLFLDPIKGKTNISLCQYSLSTKIGDTILSGIPVVAVGSKHSGAIDFFKQNNLGVTLTNKNEIKNFGFEMLNDYFVPDNLTRLFDRKNSIKKYNDIVLSLFKKESPLVSIITPYYNAEKYFDKTFESVLSQSYKNIEWIIVDDCSNENSYNQLKSLVENISFVKLIRLEKNAGAGYARNVGLDIAKGDYVGFLDADDLYDPEFIEKQLKFIENHGEFVFCSFRRLTDKSSSVYKVPKIATYKRILKGSCLSTMSLFMTRELIGETRYPINSEVEDFIFNLEILKKCKKAYGNREVLSTYRIVKGSKSNNKRKLSKKMWHVYHKELNFNFIKSLFYFSCWAIHGIWKYIKVK